MPQKINMVISNGNPSFQQQLLNKPALGSTPHMASPTAPSSLNASMLSRIHNVRVGCGSCGSGK